MIFKRFAALAAVFLLALSLMFSTALPACADQNEGGGGSKSQLDVLESALKKLGDVMAEQDPYGPVDAEVMSLLADYISAIHNADIAAQAERLFAALEAMGKNPDSSGMEKISDMLNQFNRVTKASGLGTISATESWPITRMMVFGTKNVLTADGTSQLVKSGLEPKVFFDAVMANVMRCITGDESPDEKNLDKILKEITEYYNKQIEKLDNEWASAGPKQRFDAGVDFQIQALKTERDDLMGKSLNAFDKQRIEDAAKRQEAIKINLRKMSEVGGLIGVSGSAANDTIYTRMRLIALIVLFSAFFARILFMLFGSVIGSSRHGTLGPLALIFKMLFLILMILAVPNIAVFGMKTSDIVRTFLLDPNASHTEYTPGQRTSLALAELDDLITLRYKLHGSGEQITQTTFADYFASGFIFIVGVCASAIVGAMLILGDVMMGITCCTGTLVLAMSMIPSCEKWTEHATKAWLTYLIFAPMTSLFIIAMRILFTLTGGMTILTFVIVCVVCIKLMSDLPKMCEAMSSAVMTGVVATLALTPGKTAMVGTEFAAKASLKGAGKLGKWAYSKVF